jgi:hypothetical protein
MTDRMKRGSGLCSEERGEDADAGREQGEAAPLWHSVQQPAWVQGVLASLRGNGGLLRYPEGRFSLRRF